MSEPLITVNLASEKLNAAVTKIISGKLLHVAIFFHFESSIDHQLTVPRLTKLDILSITAVKGEMDILTILQKKANLMVERPLSMLRNRKLFRGVSLSNQALDYRQVSDGTFKGFYHALDPVSMIQRAREVEKGKSAEAKEKDMAKYGQVAAVAHNFEWNFSWTDICHPALKKYLNGEKKIFNTVHMLKREREELVNHLVGELFFYFRQGIPNYYMNFFLDKLVSDFPCFNDRRSCHGYVGIQQIESTDHFLILSF